LHQLVVSDGLFARGDLDLLGLGCLGAVLAGAPLLFLLGVLSLDVGRDLVAHGSRLELDVRFGEPAYELRPIAGLLRRLLEEALQALDLRDQERSSTRLQPRLARVTFGELAEVGGIARLGVVASSLALGWRRLALEGDTTLLLGAELGRAPRAGRNVFMSLRGNTFRSPLSGAAAFRLRRAGDESE